MRIQPISNNNQTQFKAVNKKYYDWALKESQGINRFNEVFFQLKTEVAFEKMSRTDAVDTLKSIRTFIKPGFYEALDNTINFVKNWPEN